jgi:hypothetical protein
MLVMVLLNHSRNGTTKVTWPWRNVIADSCSRCRRRVMLAMALPCHVSHGVMSLPSHAGDGAAKATLAMASCHCRVMLRWCYRGDVGCGMMSLPSLAGDGATEATLAVA